MIGDGYGVIGDGYGVNGGGYGVHGGGTDRRPYNGIFCTCFVVVVMHVANSCFCDGMWYRDMVHSD